MLDSERNADDGQEAHERGHEVADAEPETADEEPDHVAEEPDRTGSHIGPTRKLSTIDRLAAEREETKFAEHKAGARPRDADNRERRHETG